MYARILNDIQTDTPDGQPVTFPEDSFIRDIDALVFGSNLANLLEEALYSIDPDRLDRMSINDAIQKVFAEHDEKSFRDEDEYEDEDEYDSDPEFDSNPEFDPGEDDIVSIIGTDDLGQIVLLKEISALDVMFYAETPKDIKLLESMMEFSPQLIWEDNSRPKLS